VLLHQTIIGLETEKQLAKVGDYPDVVIGCAGGGSNFAGLAFPYVRDKIAGKADRYYCSRAGILPHHEPRACSRTISVTRLDDAAYAHAHAGHAFVPAPIHAGGLRYHGMAPLVSQLVMDRLIEPRAVLQLETFAAGVTWARTEGFISAPETCHALATVIQEAKEGQRGRQAKDHIG